MTTAPAICQVLGIDTQGFSKNEMAILEAELFAQLCEKLKKVIKKRHKDYFHLLKFDIKKENAVIEANFIRCVINDILSTEEYTLAGIAYHTDTPEDVIYELAMGRNTAPTLFLSTKIIALHRSVRPSLYYAVMNKVAKEYSAKIAGDQR
ncbi:MAG TPA: hypothetical protein VHZ76_02790 [Gammaproteobacteria bacterium]|jgi:hypothetical protein|nr:hypothetical protein [Gammaproteobacteria bacterium]